MSHDAANLSPVLTPALEHRSSSSSAQYITLPNSPSTSSSNQATPTNNNNKYLTTPLSPPPPSIHDDETAQEVDLALAKRHSKPWAKLSPMSPFQSPSKRKDNGDEDEEIEARQRPEVARQSTMSRLIRPSPTRNETGNATIASIKLDGLIRKGTLVEKEKILYRYAYVYENQRGFARFRTLKFSSRALKIFFHYRDPAPFTKYEEEDGKVEEIDLPYGSLVDVQLPSPEWAWHGAEWLIDMAGDGMTSYDGFQYSTSFHASTWRPHPPAWHSYFLTCCRRRRWLRLMVYLPSFISPDSAGNFRPPGHIPEASEPPSPLPPSSSTANLGLDKKDMGDSSSSNSPKLKSPVMPRHEPVDLHDIWHSVPSDWTRAHAALKSVKSDGRRLELWKLWLGDEGEVEEDITGLGRMSLERRRKEEEKGGVIGRGSRDSKKSSEGKKSLDGKKSLEKDKKGKKSILAKVKGNNNKRGVQWTEDDDDENHHAWTNSGGATISYLMTDEPLPLEGQRAPREAVASVLRNHAEEILASFIYPDSRAKFHDMLLRCGLLDNLPSGLSWSIATDFRERLEL